jgi:VWFA-related protein
MKWLRLGCVVLLTGAVQAQQAELPTFRGGTTIVEFTFVAVDSDGQPVIDLRQDEVTVEESGRAQTASFCQRDGDVEPEPTPVSDPGVPLLLGNRIDVGSGPPRNVVAILLDALNTAAGDQLSAREQILAYLKTMPGSTRVAVYRLANGLDVIHDFHEDRSMLPARLEESPKRWPPFVSTDVAELECLAGGGCTAAVELEQFDTVQYQMQGRLRREQTLAAMGAIGDHLEGIPGRRTITRSRPTNSWPTQPGAVCSR